MVLPLTVQDVKIFSEFFVPDTMFALCQNMKDTLFDTFFLGRRDISSFGKATLVFQTSSFLQL